MPQRWDTVAVDDSQMRCYVALPEGRGPVPGVVVCMHAPGIDRFIQSMAGRLADEGFAAIAPDLYHRDPGPEDEPLARMGRLRDEPLSRDLAAATAHLRALPEVARDRIGVIGFCMGGRCAWLHAANDRDLRAAVVFYGGNLFVPWGGGPSPFERSGDIACPVLGLFGAEDTNPSPDDVKKLEAELERLGRPHELHSYEGAGHAFLNFERPSHRPEAATDAWARCVDWLRRHLR